jgi:carbohydrate-selective porin OprB
MLLIYRMLSRPVLLHIAFYLSAATLFASGVVQASQLDEALQAGESSANFFEGALTGLYQDTRKSDEDTGNFEVDLIGSFVLKQRDGGTLGDTDFVFWGFSVDNIGNLQSTGQMREKSGLLWDTNDINVDSNVTQFGVFGIRQFFYDDHLELGIGRVFPGMVHTESAYTANNSQTFSSKVISSSAIGGYFEAIGLGANLKYSASDWFVQGGFSDAKAESEFDFSSLGDGVLAWTAETGWTPGENGDTSISLLGFSVDETQSLTQQNGWAIAATHDFGNDGEYAVFGRYTWASGGEGITPGDKSSALPLGNGGFLGFAWNRPFSRENDQLGIALLYGKPTTYQQQQGFNTQYGLESFWRVKLGEYFNLSPSLQLIRNREEQLETILGIRLKFSIS